LDTEGPKCLGAIQNAPWDLFYSVSEPQYIHQEKDPQRLSQYEKERKSYVKNTEAKLIILKKNYLVHKLEWKRPKWMKNAEA
jgi:hypothetical protein